MLGILRDGASTGSELLRATGVDDAALEAALVREVQALLAREALPPEPEPLQGIPPVVGPAGPALDPESDDPTGALRLVHEAFAALQAGDLEGHLAHVHPNMLSGEYGVRVGIPPYRDGLQTLLTYVLPKGSPEFAMYDAGSATDGVTWVHAGWWLTYPHPQHDTNVRVLYGYRVAVKGGQIVAVHHGQRDDKGVDLPEWRVCAICKAALPHDTPELLCADHAAERDRRLAGPLPLAQLSQRWGDTLARAADLAPPCATNRWPPSWS